MIEQIDHINIVVRDLQTMTGFYCDVLGLRVTKSVTISGAWIDDVVDLTDVLAHVVYLDFAAGPRIELIQYERPVADEDDSSNLANTFGLRHMAFRVSNIEEVLGRLERAGVRPNSSIAAVPRSQVQYADNAQKRLVYFRDPEGNLLELCEYKN